MLKATISILFSVVLISFSTINTKTKNSENDFVVTPIAKNIYSIVSPNYGLPTPENKGWNSNSHFIVTKKGVLLFDTGSSEQIGNKIKNAIKQVTDQPVRWVVNSHGHADHWLGNAAFTDTAYEIITSKHTLSIMKSDGQGSLNFYNKVTKGSIGTTKLVYPNLLLEKGEKRNFGGIEVEFIFSNNGHSPGDVLMWLPRQKIILGGDVLSSDWMPIITDHGDVTNLISTLRFVEKLKPSIVLTGHGNATTIKSVIRDADLLSRVWEQVKIDSKNNKEPKETILDIKSELGEEYSALYRDFNAEIERHIKLMYKLLK